MSNTLPLSRKRICKRCNRRIAEDMICAGCKNELLTHYNSKIGWKMAYEMEKVSRHIIRNTFWFDSEEPLSS
jgi:cytochrome c-type biogenesis protein CcmH/NrfF